MAAGIPLIGKVVDGEGHPVEGASVMIVGSSVAVPEIALLSASDGSFRLSLEPGNYRFRAFGVEAQQGETVLELGTDGPAVFEIELH